jgi:hypothetical protein
MARKYSLQARPSPSSSVEQTGSIDMQHPSGRPKDVESAAPISSSVSFSSKSLPQQVSTPRSSAVPDSHPFVIAPPPDYDC